MTRAATIIELASARVGKRTTPHGLRHAFVTHGAKTANGDLTSVQVLARHKSQASTLVYLDDKETAARELLDAMFREG